MKKIGILIERERAFSRDLCLGIIKYAQECRNWSLTMLDFESLISTSDIDNFDGFIIRAINDKIVSTFSETKKPVIDLFEEMTSSPFVRVMQNPTKIAQMAARHFLQHHFSTFGFFGHEGVIYSDLRRKAFVECLRLHRKKCFVYKTPKSTVLNFEKDVMLWEKYNVNKEKTAIANYIKQVPKPIAVFCSNDLRAHQLISVCHELKIKVPEEVSILGVDNDEMLCAFSSPSISSINPNGHGIGYKAAQTLAAMMDGEKVNPVISIQPSQLVSRSSSEVFSLDALPSWMSDALVFINANISKCLSASDVYNHVKRSHTIIDNAFREKLNTSVSKEIQLSRLREAHRLVTTTKLPFSTVSKLSGFASVQYFTRSFTAAYGKSPTVLREKYI
ncbi:MAG: substrate-binding domain-containing protein [Kiritimatiellae bacterium]|nr:substrate-binding domain-containing protein [Kiritimatiellia bacterium]